MNYPMSTMPKSDAEWEAECDARTLAEAEKIRGDEGRLGRAQEAAERLAKEAQEHADNLAHVVGWIKMYK